MQNEEEFTQVFREDRHQADTEKMRQDLIRVAKRLVEKNPDVGAIILECTNMPPWSKGIQEVTGLPVFDIYTLTNFVASAFLKKQPYGFM